MKRRNFVRNAALSTFGLHVMPGLPFSSWLQPSDAQQWLRQLITAGAAKSCHQDALSAAAFQDLIKSPQADFARQNYLPQRATVYTYQAGADYCFYPLQLRPATTGLTDLLVPIFTRDNTGTWRHVHTLNSYQLEALARASLALEAEKMPLQNVLFPVAGRLSTLQAGEFNTLDGRVSIITRLQSQGAVTSIQVISHDQVLFQTSFLSRHRLTFDRV